MRAVLHTNIAVAGLLWRGKPYELFGLTLTGRVLCFASDTLLAELERVLGYEKLARRIATLHTTVRDLLAAYRSLVEIVPAATISPTVIADPHDDHVLACAIAANADFIVSGDNDIIRKYARLGWHLFPPGFLRASSVAAGSPPVSGAPA